MSAGREFQVNGAATEKAQRASSVCMRGTTSIGASEERRARGGAWVFYQLQAALSLVPASLTYTIRYRVQNVDYAQSCQTDRPSQPRIPHGTMEKFEKL